MGMIIYFSGIGGVGIGPLALIAADAGHTVVGSDPTDSLIAAELRSRGITIDQSQSGAFLRACHQRQPIDWFVHTAALPDDHPELVLARHLGIRTSKRDELLATIIKDQGLQLIAVAGTHGKTTTTGMLVWALRSLDIPVSYSVGSTLSFGPSGCFVPGSRWFVYECDEFDRNFLQFHPHLSLITTLDHDHVDTYPTAADYVAAFRQFGRQSGHVLTWAELAPLLDQTNLTALTAVDPRIRLPGAHNRRNASLVLRAIEDLHGPSDAVMAINRFPGTGRRFERLADGLYSDYGHHPVEIKATLQLARELSDQVVLVYQPHQNSRQHEIRAAYTEAIFADAEAIYWLPTYLTREDPALPVLSPRDLTKGLMKHPATAGRLHYAQMDDALWATITTALAAGKLVLCMGAGTIDEWVRQRATKL